MPKVEDVTTNPARPAFLVSAPGVPTVEVQKAPVLTNWRTLLINGAIVMAAAGLQYGAGIDWTQYVSPTVAVILVGVLNGILRSISSGPVGSDVVVKKVA